MKILIVGPGRESCMMLGERFREKAFIVDLVEDLKEGIRQALVNDYDGLVLDIQDDTTAQYNTGNELLRDIRERRNSVPIIIVAKEMAIEQKVDLFNYCDDILQTPYSVRELIARVEAVLRRGESVSNEVLVIDDLSLDPQSLVVARRGEKVELRNKEIALLEYFMRHPDTVLTRGDLLEHVWDMNIDPFSNTVDVHVRLLRKKLDTGYDRKLIHTIVGRGYKMVS